jgi:hypothetical protein
VSRGPARPVRSAVAGAAVAVACVAAAGAPACTYPDFQFGDADDGEGGQGGGGSSSSGPEGPRVPCSHPPVLCLENDVSCLHETDIAQHHCGALGECGPSFAELRCNGPTDCPVEAPVCCAKDDEPDGYIEIIACQATCNAVTEITVCELPTDCPSAQCVPLFASGYEGYNQCVPL